MNMIKTSYFLISLLIISGLSSFSTINASATLLEKQSEPEEPFFEQLPTIFEDERTEEIHAKVTQLLIDLMNYEEEKSTILKLKSNKFNYSLLQKETIADAESKRISLDSEKSTLQNELGQAVLALLKKYSDFNKAKFSAQKFIDLIQEKRFWDREELPAQVNFVIRECMLKVDEVDDSA